VEKMAMRKREHSPLITAIMPNKLFDFLLIFEIYRDEIDPQNVHFLPFSTNLKSQNLSKEIQGTA